MRSILISCALLAVISSAASAQQGKTLPCSNPKYHDLDFWVGQWDVHRADGKLVAHSLIERVYGCGIRENWMPFDGETGGSLSIYIPAEDKWEQFWIDSSGNRVVFSGGWNGRAMVITGLWPDNPNVATGPLVRMTYTKNADLSVRQFGGAVRGQREDLEEGVRLFVSTELFPLNRLWFGLVLFVPWGINTDASAQTQAPPTPPCRLTTVARNLDFWVGDWDVYVGTQLDGHDRIESILRGCALIETWHDVDGSEGKSLFAYDARRDLWTQTWITDNSSVPGGIKFKVLRAHTPMSTTFQGEIEGHTGTVYYDRTILTALPDGRVHQQIQVSKDGVNWRTDYDALYVRKAKPQ